MSTYHYIQIATLHDFPSHPEKWSIRYAWSHLLFIVKHIYIIIVIVIKEDLCLHIQLDLFDDHFWPNYLKVTSRFLTYNMHFP